MEQQDEFHTLLDFFKVLGNESRLRIVGILANQDCTVGELATLLDLKEPTVSGHLSMLKHFNFVTVRPDGNQRIYSFNPALLHSMSKDIFTRERLASLVDNVEDDYEHKVLRTFFEGDRLTAMPMQEKKRRVVLRWLAGHFDESIRYPEKQVNEILTRFHPDYALLRRELVDWGFMTREKGIYWRVVSEDTANND
jgi:hypothetical protein